MARPKKTIATAAIRVSVNSMLAESTCDSETRMGMIAVLEEILHATDNYRGYGYLTDSMVPYGEKPGIIRSESGNHSFPDESRRVYY